MADVFLGFGANEGDREGNIKMALFLLEQSSDISIMQVSSLYETKVLGGYDQPDFINLVVRVETELDPHSLLDMVKSIEASLGRIPDTHMQPRPIDIDILLYDSEELHTEELMIPHSRLTTRRFVLEPLVEIEPMAIDPVSSKKLSHFLKSTIDQDVRKIKDGSEVWDAG